MANLNDLQNAVNNYTSSLGNAAATLTAKQATASQLAIAQQSDDAAGKAVQDAKADLDAKGSALKSIIDQLTASPPVPGSSSTGSAPTPAVISPIAPPATIVSASPPQS
jgi:hypothetical protein